MLLHKAICTFTAFFRLALTDHQRACQPANTTQHAPEQSLACTGRYWGCKLDRMSITICPAVQLFPINEHELRGMHLCPRTRDTASQQQFRAQTYKAGKASLFQKSCSPPPTHYMAKAARPDCALSSSNRYFHSKVFT